MRRLWPPVSADATAVAAPKAEVAAGFAYLDGVLADQPHLVGEFSIADIAFMTRLLGVEIPPVRARVQAWRARLASRASWARTMYPPLPC